MINQILPPRFRSISFFALFAITLLIGIIHLQNVPTDPSAEKQSVEDAISIANGNHHFGIVQYSHYPNGPIYILVPFFKLNASLRNYETSRFIPLIISAFCFSLFFFFLLQSSKTLLLQAFSLLAYMVFLLQPGILNWFGALHKQAYEMAIVFLILCFGLKYLKVSKIFFLLGFIAGWIGYDFCMLQLFCMSLIRLLYHSNTYENWLNKPLIKKVISEALFGFAGVVLAIVLHLLQNSLFYGSVNYAMKDLLGAGMVRMYMDNGAVINPEYLNWLKESAKHYNNPNPFSEGGNFLTIHIKNFFVNHNLVDGRLYTTVFMFYAFLKLFSEPFTLIALFLIGFGLLFYLNRPLRKNMAGIASKMLVAFRLNFLVFISLAFLGTISWYIVMKYHAQFHYHFLPRMYFVLSLLILCFIYKSLELQSTHLKAENES
jgi:hypothetical protein